jgi:hypothetical protein
MCRLCGDKKTFKKVLDKPANIMYYVIERKKERTEK